MLTFSFFSCKKTDLTSVELQEVSLQPRSGIISALEISEWLEGLKDTSHPYTNEVIQSVIDNADWTNFYFEQLDSLENLVVVPLKEVFSQHINPDTIPLPYLILVEDENGEIRKGNIALFYPDSTGIDHLPLGSFSNFFTRYSIDVDGRLEVLTLGDLKLYEYNFLEGRVSSSEILQGKSLQAREGEKCIEYSLVTTFYFSDGTTIESSTYLFTSCSEPGGGPSDCPPGAANCDGGMFEGGGGGGGGNDQTDPGRASSGTKNQEFRKYKPIGEMLSLGSTLVATGTVFNNTTLNVFDASPLVSVSPTLVIELANIGYQTSSPEIGSFNYTAAVSQRVVSLNNSMIVSYTNSTRKSALQTGKTHFYASNFFN